MIISKSNVLNGALPSITTGVSTDLPQNLTDQDFSATYTSSNQFSLVAEFGVIAAINYIAVAGHNIKGDGSGTSYIRVYDANVVVSTINITSNQVVMVSFDPQSFVNLRVEIKNGAGTSNPAVSYIAGGLAFTVPNSGEVSGYNRQFLKRNIVSKTTINSEAAPIASLKKTKSAKGALNLPNMTKVFSEGEWQDFLDFSIDNYFFIKEQLDEVISVSEGTNKSSYLCYEVMNNSIKAHGETRSLNNITINFKVFNGL